MRDEKGRFVPGTTGNPKGRARKAQEVDYLAAFRKVITRQAMEELLAVILSEALQGSKSAQRVILEYALPKPSQQVEISGADGAPVQTEIIVRYADNYIAETSSVADADQTGEETL